MNRSRWKAISTECVQLADTAEDCLHEWGGFLDGHLFEDALIHFNGGETECIKRLPVTRDGLLLGHHRIALHGEQVGFVVSSLDELRLHERHLNSLLACLSLEAIQWIDIRGSTMEMVTIET